MVHCSHQNIFLIGPSGAGKSSIGELLARKLGKTFFDTDVELAKQTGVSLSWIFEVEGEEGLQKRETNLLSQLVKKQGIVLSTGASAIVAPENRLLLRSNGTMIYLKTSVGQQKSRVHRKEHRPLLQVDNLEERLEELKRDWTPLYEEIADITVSTDSQTIHAVLAILLAELANS